MDTKENRSPNKKRAFTWGMNDTLKECIFLNDESWTMNHSLWYRHRYRYVRYLTCMIKCQIETISL